MTYLGCRDCNKAIKHKNETTFGRLIAEKKNANLCMLNLDGPERLNFGILEDGKSLESVHVLSFFEVAWNITKNTQMADF